MPPTVFPVSSRIDPNARLEARAAFELLEAYASPREARAYRIASGSVRAAALLAFRSATVGANGIDPAVSAGIEAGRRRRAGLRD